MSSATDSFCSPNSSIVDLWQNDKPAARPSGQYEEEAFVSFATKVIQDFAWNRKKSGDEDDGSRLFLYYASHAPHTPMQVPQRLLDRLLAVNRSLHSGPSLTLPGLGYAAMVAVVDEAVANLTQALKAADMWSSTLFVFQVSERVGE